MTKDDQALLVFLLILTVIFFAGLYFGGYFPRERPPMPHLPKWKRWFGLRKDL